MRGPSRLQEENLRTQGHIQGLDAWPPVLHTGYMAPCNLPHPTLCPL